MKKTIFFALLLFIGTMLMGVSFTDVEPVEVDIGIEQAYLIQDACDLTVVTILTLELTEVALPKLFRTTFTENVIQGIEMYYLLIDLSPRDRVIATNSAATSLNHWQNGNRYHQPHLRGPSSTGPGVA